MKAIVNKNIFQNNFAQNNNIIFKLTEPVLKSFSKSNNIENLSIFNAFMNVINYNQAFKVNSHTMAKLFCKHFSRNSAQWMDRHKNDIYVKKSVEV